jgi:hypothetical protein
LARWSDENALAGLALHGLGTLSALSLLPAQSLSRVVGGPLHIKQKARTKSVLAVGILISLTFQEKRQQVRSLGWQFMAAAPRCGRRPQHRLRHLDDVSFTSAYPPKAAV